LLRPIGRWFWLDWGASLRYLRLRYSRHWAAALEPIRYFRDGPSAGGIFHEAMTRYIVERLRQVQRHQGMDRLSRFQHRRALRQRLDDRLADWPNVIRRPGAVLRFSRPPKVLRCIL